jgi:hypothetical protein
MRRHQNARGVPSDKATWEHIDNENLDPKDLINIVISCGACNTSKGAKNLLEWFESEYCKRKDINKRTVSRAVKEWLRRYRRR